MKKMISRRDFLKVAGISAAALSLAACGAFIPSRASLFFALCFLFDAFQLSRSRD